MAKQSVIAGEYVLQIEDNGHVNVVRVPRNAKATMIKISEKKGFKYDPKWNTQYFGYALCKEFGDKWSVKFDDITITRQKDNKIEIFQECRPVKGALKEICEKMGFEYDYEWNTQYFGYRVVKYLSENKGKADKILQTSNKNKCETQAPVCSDNSQDSRRITKNWEEYEENGKYGFKDENGNVVIPCKYDFVGRWTIGRFCQVEIENKIGYIDVTGKVIVPIEYDYVEYLDKCNCFVVTQGNRISDRKVGVISPEGKIIFPLEYDYYNTRWLENKCVLKKDGVSFIMGEGGVIERRLPYDYYEDFDYSTDLSLVKRDGKWGYVNRSLEEVIPCENQCYALGVVCNPYILDSMPMDSDTLEEGFDFLAAEYEDEFDKLGISEETQISKDNFGELLAISGRRVFEECGSESHSYVDEVEKIVFSPIDDWWNGVEDNDVVFYPNEVNIENTDYPINKHCIEVVYKRYPCACELCYRLLIPYDEEIDPSRLKIVNPNEDSQFIYLPDVFYDEKPLKLYRDGFGDAEFEYSTARLFWDGEEIDLPSR